MNKNQLPTDDQMSLGEVEAARRARAARPVNMPASSVLRIERQVLARLGHYRRSSRAPGLLARWALALSLVGALIIATGGVVNASTTSLPGDALYPVKRLTENVQSVLTPASDQPALNLSFAANRLAEIEALADQGVVLPGIIEDMANETELALISVDSVPDDRQADLLAQLATLSERQQSVLAQVQANAPESAREALEHAQSVSERAQQAIQNSGGITPPGQAKTPNGPKRTATPSPTGTEAVTTSNAELPTSTSTLTGLQQKPPDHQLTRPGQQSTPPGQQRTPPGQQRTPPGQQKTPPGQGDDSGKGGGNDGGGGGGGGHNP